MQTIVQGEARTAVVGAVLLTGPTGRQFFLRMGRAGQVARFEVELEVVGDVETLTDGKKRLVLQGTISAANTALLAKGLADVTVRATNPDVRLLRSQVEVDVDMGPQGRLT